jgi:diaminohydroxyphosphoribosylaminopyrimidine deaminase / 5-amino-6-(5-phosphoribosylamino)uracil reductase
LKRAGIKVTTGVLQDAARALNKRFFTFHEKKRPYIFLKWAQTADGFMARENYKAVPISNEWTNRYTHSMRAKEEAIMIGTRTVLYDNPALTTRHWAGKNPVRIVIDKQCQVPPTANIFNKEAHTIILNQQQELLKEDLEYHLVLQDIPLPNELIELLNKKNLTSVIIEGGGTLLQSFIDQGLWDEALIITNTKMNLGSGIPAPVMKNAGFIKEWWLKDDLLQVFNNYK